MTLDELFESGEPTKWIEALEPYQQRTLTILGLGTQDPEKVARNWLESTTVQNAPFGAAGSSRPFFDSVKKEVLGFLCGDHKYAAERDRLKANSNISELFVVSLISQTVSCRLRTLKIANRNSPLLQG